MTGGAPTIGSDDTEQTLDRIYEAGAIPERWPGLLGDVGVRVGMDGGALFTADASLNVRWIASESLMRFGEPFVSDGWIFRNSRAAKLAPMRHPGFVGDLDLFTPEEMDNDPFYTDFLRKVGLGWGVGSIIASPTRDVMVVTFEGGKAPVTRESTAWLDRLRPHFARASLISARLKLERIRSALEALERLALPAAALDRNGATLAANESFAKLDPRFAVRKSRTVSLNILANPGLTTALCALAASDSHGARSLPVRGTDQHEPAIVHLVPVKGAARDVFLDAVCIVIVTPLAPTEALPADVLQGLFDLTPAEARVAACVGAGISPQDTAAKLGVSYETVRSQLKQVFSKTGVTRQTELVALLPKLWPRETRP